MNYTRTKIYSLVSPKPADLYPQLYPGDSMIFSFKGYVRFPKKSCFNKLNNRWFLDCKDFAHILEGSGKYKIYAIYYFKSLDNPPYDDIWEGRVVSEPAEVVLNLPE